MMSRASNPIFSLVLILALSASCTKLAFAQTRVATDACAPYYAAITGDSSTDQSKSAPPLPDRLLTDWRTALPCLVIYLQTLQPNVTSPSFANSPDIKGKFLRATGAVRTIMANNPQALPDIIKKFRDVDNLSVTSVLAFGARSDDYNVRLNSILILANVIDNTTVCVPLDHLYDSSISINGRANLLSVVSVVAPWAYRQNYDNISKVQARISSTISKDDPNLKQTRDILENIDTRLKSQTEDSNKSANLPNGNPCMSYKPTWGGANLKY